MNETPVPKISEDLLREMYRHAEETYPSECCGMLLGPKGSADPTELRRMKNAYDEFHARDPEQFPRTSKTAYFMDPEELLAVQKIQRERALEIKVIYHSHVEVGAYFSEEDKRVATYAGEPVMPGVAYAVISCRKGKDGKGKSDAAALFIWDPATREFEEEEHYVRG